MILTVAIPPSNLLPILYTNLRCALLSHKSLKNANPSSIPNSNPNVNRNGKRKL